MDFIIIPVLIALVAIVAIISDAVVTIKTKGRAK